MDRTYDFKLTGDTDLLMHRDDIESADELAEVRAKLKRGESKAGDDRSPPWSWMTYLYRNGTGEVVACPFENVMAALAYGGTKIKLQGNTTFKEVSQSGICPDSDHFDFRYSGGRILKIADVVTMKDWTFKEMEAGAQKMGFRLFMKRAGVGTSKHVRVRPRFSDWVISGRVTVEDDRITPAVLKDIFAWAGKGGIMDWRPSSPLKKGRFGMFSSEVVEAREDGRKAA